MLWQKADESSYTEVSAQEMQQNPFISETGITQVWSELKENDTLPGENVVVAVIDTGVDYSHEELSSAMWVNNGEIPGNGIDDDGNGYTDDIYGYDFVEGDGDPMDDHGHGTHVSGIIAMENNGKGGIGIAYGAKIMAVKAGQSTGVFSSSDVAKAIRYAAQNGADVINMSFSGIGRSALVEAALEDASNSCVLVAAAGNYGIHFWGVANPRPLTTPCVPFGTRRFGCSKMCLCLAPHIPNPKRSCLILGFQPTLWQATSFEQLLSSDVR